MPTTFLSRWLPLLEAEMQTQLSNSEAAVARHYGMMHYHMGWVDAGLAPDRLPAGKRLRPMLLLMACAEAGGDPRQALPAAAAIEILHMTTSKMATKAGATARPSGNCGGCRKPSMPATACLRWPFRPFSG
jgi:hypothetical protein